MNKRFIFMVLSLTLVLVLGFAPLCAQDEEAESDLTVVNDTGVTIDQLYVSAATTNDWEEDVLGVDVLNDGEECGINFSPDEEECMWDIMIKDKEGTAIYWKNLNLCEISKVTLHFADGTPTATVE